MQYLWLKHCLVWLNKIVNIRDNHETAHRFKTKLTVSDASGTYVRPTKYTVCSSQTI